MVESDAVDDLVRETIKSLDVECLCWRAGGAAILETNRRDLVTIIVICVCGDGLTRYIIATTLLEWKRSAKSTQSKLVDARRIVISTELERAKSYWHSDLPGEMSIPVARPRLPTSDEIAPYLRRIDASRWYSNGGPLMQEFEERLANHFGAGNVRTATVANATIGLTVALLAHDLPHGSLCMVPAWTFAATGHAIELAGLVPWIVDVSLTSWALEPEAARDLCGVRPEKFPPSCR